MSIGKRRDRVTLSNTTETHLSADSWGRTDTQVQECVLWADVEQMSSEKRFVDLTGRHIVNYKVTTRFNSAIETGSRLTWNGKQLWVNDVQGDRLTDTMIMTCYEKVTP